MNNPWLTIWTKPRQTIIAIVSSNPNQFLWHLAAVYGFSALLNLFQSSTTGATINPLALFIIAAIFAPFWGYLIFAFWGGIITLTGKIFRGQGTFQEIRSAYAWSNVPVIVNIPIWLIMGLMFGKQLFLNFPEGYVLTSAQSTILFFLLIAKLVVSIWSLVIFINTLAAVQKFSILQSIGNIIVGVIVLFAVLILLYTLMSIFTGVAVINLVQP